MSEKSIIFINQSAGYLMIDIINEHAKYYDDIVLLTGFLNPRETQLHQKVKVKKLITYQRNTTLTRLYTWLLFWFQSLYYIIIRYPKHKLYFVSNPPLNIFTARWTRRKFAFLFYDVLPIAFAQKNILKTNSWLYKYWEASNQKVFKKVVHLYTLSKGMRDLLCIPESLKHKTKVVPVWSNNTFFKHIPSSENLFIKKYSLQHKFIVSYSGNLGKTHPVEVLIKIAEKLTKYPEILFLIIGEGEKKAQLQQIQKKLKLPNLQILDFQPTVLLPHVLAAAQIGVVTLESNAADISVPSKTFNLMSAGKPVLSIANPNSELARIITDNNIGGNFSENEIEKISDFILQLKKNQHIIQKMGENSKALSHQYTSKNAKQMILKP